MRRPKGRPAAAGRRAGEQPVVAAVDVAAMERRPDEAADERRLRQRPQRPDDGEDRRTESRGGRGPAAAALGGVWAVQRTMLSERDDGQRVADGQGPAGGRRRGCP